MLLAPEMFWLAGSYDTTAPIAALVTESATTISQVTGFDTTLVTWHANEAFQHYKFKVVTGAGDAHTAGVLIEADESPASGGTATTDYVSTISGAEVAAASPGDGAKLVKLFVQDLAGNWST